MNFIQRHVSENGDLNLPASVRHAVGLDQGGDVIVELDGRDIRIRRVDDVIDHAQSLTRKLLGGAPEAGVDAFLAERRQDAGRE
ncbi:AbrB/MazE/SpoVT family DNA-binding domain-containing protein [Indioceanicola profundi]|uniref:AbrB/MazE/SpoVT family DNA-binding domain-containing protein n=1 Tax=Indioceanicola profundi TaxID=2220096 RepID=UPI001969019F|nr:AbrB/MazE/SpoVT family DNA-binding domain-containing protein [Indioceanicola profundi]